MLRNSSTLSVSVPINLSIKLEFVSVNSPRETYFVDAPFVCVYIYIYTYRVLKNNVYNVSGMIEEVKTNTFFI